MVKSRQNRRKNTSDSSTQTSPLMTMWNPSVIVQRLNLHAAADPSELSIKDSLLITANSKPTSISRAPYNYQNFVKPITNNQKVNSTLGSLSDVNECTKRYATRKSAEHRKVAFIRPGPMCYKRRVLQTLDEDMEVPIMLGDPTRSTHSLNGKVPVSLPLASVNLDTILENTDEDSVIPELEMNFDFEHLDGLDSNNVETQTAEDISVPRIAENAEALYMETIGGSSSEAVEDQPQKININFRGVTTVISRASTRMSEKSSDSSANETRTTGDGDCNFDKEQRFLKIKAHTVHIHNHFYKP